MRLYHYLGTASTIVSNHLGLELENQLHEAGRCRITTMPGYDDTAVEEQWCRQQRANVEAHLCLQHVTHGRIGEWPAWHLAPYVSIWAIESAIRPEWIGWWVISGDLPTDYISAADVVPPQHPRKAVRVIAEGWLKVVEAWNAGQEHEDIEIGASQSHEELAPLLESRAKLLIQWADDDSVWDE